MPIERNTEHTKKMRFECAKKILSFIEAGNIPIFIDETGFRSDLVPLMRYARKGKLFTAPYSNNKHPNHSVITASTIFGIVGL